MSKSITEIQRFDLAAAGATGATSQVDGVTFDMTADGGYDGIVFFGRAIATANAGNFVQVQQGQTSNMSDAATLAGSRATAVANNDFILINVPKVTERYVRCNVVRAGATTATNDIFAIRYRAGGPLPITQTGSNRIVVNVAIPAVEGTP